MTYIVAIKSFTFKYIPNNILIVLTLYIHDDIGNLFFNAEGNLDAFDITISSLPSSNYFEFFKSLVETEINNKYAESTSWTIDYSRIEYFANIINFKRL